MNFQRRFEERAGGLALCTLIITSAQGLRSNSATQVFPEHTLIGHYRIPTKLILPFQGESDSWDQLYYIS